MSTLNTAVVKIVRKPYASLCALLNLKMTGKTRLGVVIREKLHISCVACAGGSRLLAFVNAWHS
jgi:hypothetical protein